MVNNAALATILVAEDDESDRFLIAKALQSNGVGNPVRFLDDGRELVDLLTREAQSPEATSAGCPSYLILLDLNMPRMDGREALKVIKGNAALRCIPTIVLTTSSADEDVVASYADGANSFFTKPVDYAELVQMFALFKKYWLEGVAFPS